MIFNLGQNHYTCIDIGAYAVKVVMLQKLEDSSLKILDARYEQLPPETIQDGKITDHAIIENKLNSIFSSLSNRPKNILTTISSSNLITRNIELPLLDKGELKEAIKWELDDVLPFDSDKTIFDYIITSTNEETMNLLVIAVKEEVIDNFMKPFENINYTPEVINAQSTALLSLLKYQSNLEGPTAVIDIGHHGSRVILGDEYNIQLSRDIDNGGRNFTDEIIEMRNFNYKEAEDYKMQTGINSKEDTDDEFTSESSLLGFGNELYNIGREIAEEISRSLE